MCKNRSQLKKALMWASLTLFVMIGSVVSANAIAQTFPVGTVFPEKHIVSQMTDKFAELVQNKTDGEIKINVHYGSPFGDVYQISKQITNGQRKLDVVSMDSEIDKRLSIGYMGGLVSNFDQARKLYGPDGKFIALLNDIGKDVGYKMIAWAPTGFGGIDFHGDAPSTLPSDKAYKTRVAPYKAMIAGYKALGLDPIPMPYSQTYTALQTGQIDAKGASPPQEAAQVFADITDTYIYSKDYFEGIIGVAVNLKWFNSLPEKTQKSLIDAGHEATEFAWKDAKQRDQKFLDVLRDKGVNVVTFSPEEYDQIKEIERKSEWPVLEKQIGKNIMDKIRSMAY